MIAIIDYGMGNFKSIQNMLKRIGAESVITSDNKVIAAADKLILAGVGAFGSAMKRLRQMEIIPLLNDKVLNHKTPVLGICLGMQLLSKKSEEGGHFQGLSWIDAETIRFDFQGLNKKLKIPHMGWNGISKKRESPLLNGLNEESRFYFVHSYHVKCANEENVITTTFFGIDFVSSVQNQNIFGTQFHPEKSHKFGMKVLRNFCELAR